MTAVILSWTWLFYIATNSKFLKCIIYIINWQILQFKVWKSFSLSSSKLPWHLKSECFIFFFSPALAATEQMNINTFKWWWMHFFLIGELLLYNVWCLCCESVWIKHDYIHIGPLPLEPLYPSIPSFYVIPECQDGLPVLLAVSH